MKILHITPHLGGGVGTVITDWMGKVDPEDHAICCLDYANPKAANKVVDLGIDLYDNRHIGFDGINLDKFDIILIHFWDHPMLIELISQQLPPCRLVFWCHKNYSMPSNILLYPDLCIGTSLIQNMLDGCIKSTGNMQRFLELKPIDHGKFNVGYAGTIHPKKIHPMIFDACRQISEKIPVKFTFYGEVYDKYDLSKFDFDLLGKVDDIAPYLATMDVFGYPLRLDHYGTSEIVLGEAMAAGLPVVCMDNPCERLIVQEGLTGFLCKSKQEYIDNIEHLYHKPVLRKWMGQNAREAASEMYNIDNMVARWNQIFDQMMNDPKKEHSL
jgi:glycosyltransferase involved in cell wall biosynthesis